MKKAAIGFLALILAGVVAFAAASVTGNLGDDLHDPARRDEAGHHLHADRREPGRFVDDAASRRAGRSRRSSRAPARSRAATSFSPSRCTGRDGAEMKTEYKAKLVDDNNMTGTFERNMGGNAQTIEWKAVRKPK